MQCFDLLYYLLYALCFYTEIMKYERGFLEDGDIISKFSTHLNLDDRILNSMMSQIYHGCILFIHEI